VTVKTDISRFDIHDELTAPGRSAPILKGIQTAGAAVSKFIGALAGAPVALRAYTRMRSELRAGVLSAQTRERIGLAVAEHRGDTYNIGQRARTARAAGLGLDEVSRARSFKSADPRETALLAYLEATLTGEGHPPIHLLEEAREVGWSDEEILEAVANLALSEFESLVASAAALPHDQNAPSVLPSAA
jgi:alkylhydroperoxidase family enzyme